VLIAETDHHLGAALQFALQLEGFRVETFATAADLLRQPMPPDCACLVLDDDLPEMGGLEVLRELRRRGVALPAILVASRPPKLLQAAAAELGALVVEMPLLDEALTIAIRQMLSEPG